MSATPPEYPDYGVGADGLPRYPGISPELPGLPATDMPQPPSVRTAVRLMWAGAALSVISQVAALFNLDDAKVQMREQFIEAYPDASQATIDMMFTSGIVIGFITSMIGTLLWLWMAWKNGQGRSWARVVATVLGGFAVVSGIISFATSGVMAVETTPTNIVIGAATLVLAIVILVLMWRKESSAFYAARSAPRIWSA